MPCLAVIEPLCAANPGPNCVSQGQNRTRARMCVRCLHIAVQAGSSLTGGACADTAAARASVLSATPMANARDVSTEIHPGRTPDAPLTSTSAAIIASHSGQGCKARFPCPRSPRPARDRGRPARRARLGSLGPCASSPAISGAKAHALDALETVQHLPRHRATALAAPRPRRPVVIAAPRPLFPAHVRPGPRRNCTNAGERTQRMLVRMLMCPQHHRRRRGGRGYSGVCRATVSSRRWWCARCSIARRESGAQVCCAGPASASMTRARIEMCDCAGEVRRRR